jgi:hypothetical protein
MTESPSAQQSARIPGPREVLDASKRAKIIGMLSMGCSRRMAARQVGCAPSTITRTADRDEEFREEVAEAESQSDIRALRLIRNTAQQERYWRVAAWILERRNPEEYGRRAPHTFTGTQVTELLLRGLREVVTAVPEEVLPDVLTSYYDLLSNVAETANLRPLDPEDLLAEVMPDPEEGTTDQETRDEETADEAAEPQAEVAPKQPEVPLERTHLAPRDVRPDAAVPSKTSPADKVAPSRNGSAVKPHTDREEYVSLAAVRPSVEREECASPRRTSCLEQFVTRSPKQELQTAGT